MLDFESLFGPAKKEPERHKLKDPTVGTPGVCYFQGGDRCTVHGEPEVLMSGANAGGPALDLTVLMCRRCVAIYGPGWQAQGTVILDDIE